MAFQRNRIDGTPAIQFLRPGSVIVCGQEASIELRLSADRAIELYFPAPVGSVEVSWLELAADLLAHLKTIDNEVQRVSAEQWAASPYPSSYYEGELAHITLADDSAVLRYFVIGCNSEWDEQFVRSAGEWVRIADPEPDAAPRGEGM